MNRIGVVITLLTIFTSVGCSESQADTKKSPEDTEPRKEQTKEKSPTEIDLTEARELQSLTKVRGLYLNPANGQPFSGAVKDIIVDDYTNRTYTAKAYLDSGALGSMVLLDQTGNICNARVKRGETLVRFHTSDSFSGLGRAGCGRDDWKLDSAASSLPHEREFPMPLIEWQSNHPSAPFLFFGMTHPNGAWLAVSDLEHPLSNTTLIRADYYGEGSKALESLTCTTYVCNDKLRSTKVDVYLTTTSSPGYKLTAIVICGKIEVTDCHPLMKVIPCSIEGNDARREFLAGAFPTRREVADLLLLELERCGDTINPAALHPQIPGWAVSRMIEATTQP